MSLKRLGLILLVSGGLAAYSTWLRSEREVDPAAATRGAVPMVGGILLFRLAEVQVLYHDESARLLDVRSAPAYASGHIPGALSLPENEFDRLFPTLNSQLKRAKTIIVYCDSPRCARALRVAIRLRTNGFDQAQVYPAGWYEWLNHNMPTEP